MLLERLRECFEISQGLLCFETLGAVLAGVVWNVSEFRQFHWSTYAS